MWNNVIRHLQIDYTTDKTEDETVQDKVENCSLQEGSMKSSEEQSTVAESGYHLPLSLSTINSPTTKDSLQDKIRHAEMPLASQQANS
jgi:hypothetical protein